MKTHKPDDKPQLEVDELALKIKELDFKVREMERPTHLRLSFWASSIPLFIAIIGIFLQYHYSKIEYEQAELKSLLAKTETEKAQKEEAIAKKKIANSNRELVLLTKKRDNLQKQINLLIPAYIKKNRQSAYPTTKQENTPQPINNNTIATDTNKVLAEILIGSANETLLKNAILKVYYTSSTNSKATSINELLRSRGVKSEAAIPNFEISGVSKNQIVYYNPPQFVYCKAVQALLKQSGYGDFNIRLSSGANATTKHFKLYVVK